MKFLVFIEPKDFKDETLKSIKMFFERWDVNYKISSYTKDSCVGMHGDVVDIDFNTNLVNPDNFDGLILVDGKGIDEYKLYEFRPLLDLVMLFNNSNKWIIAFGNAVGLVARANVINNRKIATIESDSEVTRFVKLFHGTPSRKELEFDGNLITIKDSSKSNELFDTILEKLNIE
ncbi:PfpI family non-peptidase-like protein stress response protein YhbO [Candidatus Mancarchaeum acidiphilum]|uniref:PfpI family non-peptidase-like protein stress response protein YhbO n=1 Tax=Candidatus Mancarchaeum acidiphilum TaxID=1920749 RepID=A0A218NP51_9ARCH|nr:DJ-1/PfpI family protein [Candidatus Mancarchaeum acidiphilum]ASI14250.1 PfpI family non-peptidase-like protein stress response protein YhbO [Candidatus Mancarchaeum acidiphilum]